MTDDPGPSGPHADKPESDWTARVDAALDQLCVLGETMTYREFAHWLGIPGPGQIQTLTRALEATMAFDAQARRPPRASWVVSQRPPGLPAQGFFERAQQLGMMSTEPPSEIHQSWLMALRSQAQKRSTGGR